MEKIKILRIITRLNIGGPARHTVLLNEGMDTERFDTVLIAGSVAPSEGDMSYLCKDKGIRFIHLPALQREVDILKDFAALYHLFRIIRRERPHIVHTHTAKAGTLGRIAAILAGVRIKVHTFHGHIFHSYFGALKTRFFIGVERFLARWTQRLVTISKELKDEICGEFGIGRKEKFEIIPLGLELERFRTAERLRGRFREEMGISNDVLLVGIVGRLVPVKNHRLFLDCAKKFKIQSSPAKGTGKFKVQFVIIGDGELRGELESYAEVLEMSKELIFAGWRGDVERIYADMDIVALTSLNEGTPVALIEAMASAKAVVASDVGGVKDVVEDGRTGLLFESGNLEGLEKVIERLLSDSAMRTELGNNARESVCEKFSKERLIQDTQRMYERLMGE